MANQQSNHSPGFPLRAIPNLEHPKLPRDLTYDQIAQRLVQSIHRQEDWLRMLAAEADYQRDLHDAMNRARRRQEREIRERWA